MSQFFFLLLLSSSFLYISNVFLTVLYLKNCIFCQTFEFHLAFQLRHYTSLLKVNQQYDQVGLLSFWIVYGWGCLWDQILGSNHQDFKLCGSFKIVNKHSLLKIIIFQWKSSIKANKILERPQSDAPTEKIKAKRRKKTIRFVLYFISFFGKRKYLLQITNSFIHSPSI